jgi:hypothetical protein
MKVVRRTIFSLIGLLALQFSASAQTFVNVANGFSMAFDTGDAFYGCGVSYCDFNQDGWDDLSFAMDGVAPRFYINTNGVLALTSFNIPNSEETKQVLWVDYDNDGDLDVFLANRFAQNKLFENDGDFNFTDITSTSGFVNNPYEETFGASWADYDGDGDLDVYVCNFNFEPFQGVTNFLYRNNGDGTFANVSVAAGVSNGYKTSFQAVWFDYNNDNLTDLFVINDRLDFKNYLYKNNGDGTFADMSALSGLDVAMYAMSATAGDFNNDGWFDLYVSNGVQGNSLFINNQNTTFTDVASLYEVEGNTICWGANWIDYDNDTWQDLYTGVALFEGGQSQNLFWINDGVWPMTQSTTTFPLDVDQVFSSAVGDYNNDGFPDIASHTEPPWTTNVWSNQGNSNHYIKITLEGTLSNKQGIGSRIQVDSGGISQWRYTYCGEDYLNQDSQHEIIGLAQEDSVDLVTVTWPSGHVDTWEGLAADSSYYFVEGGSLSVNVDIAAESFCAGGSTTLSCSGFASYTWSNDAVGATLFVNEPGEYWVTAITQLGISVLSDTITISELPLPDFGIEVSNCSCFESMDGNLNLLNLNGFELSTLSLNGEIASPDSLQALAAGEYVIIINDINDCTSVDTVEVFQPLPLTFEINQTNVACFGGSDGMVEIFVEGGTAPYSVEYDALDPLQLEAGTYSFSIIDSASCALDGEVSIAEPAQIEFEVIVTEDPENGAFAEIIGLSGGTGILSVVWSTSDEGMTLAALEPGSYYATVTDENGCQKTVEFLVSGVGIHDFIAPSIALYPNPAKTEVVIVLPASEVSELFVTDINGKVVFEGIIPTGKGEYHLDVTEFSVGNYVFLFKFKNDVVVRKSVIIGR